MTDSSNQFITDLDDLAQGRASKDAGSGPSGQQGAAQAAPEAESPARAFASQPSASSAANKNQVQVLDTTTPIVLLFGPRTSGKTMTLVRLSRWLHRHGFRVEADTKFKPNDPAYEDKCENFSKIVYADVAQPGTALDDYMLIKVCRSTHVLCQILEAPGEAYFDPRNTKATHFPPYLSQIINASRNRRIWVFLAEANWKGGLNAAYINRIENCCTQLVSPGDRFVLLYNKVDQLAGLVFRGGQVDPAAASREMMQEYPGMTELFRNMHPITRLWRPYNYSFVPFTTGDYSDDVDEYGSPVVRYTQSNDRYPAMLWNAVSKYLRG